VLLNIGFSPREWLSDLDDRFGVALILAIAVHTIVILGVGFGVNEEGEEKLPQSLEVTLVNTQTDAVIEEADYLAQANQEGGGNTEEKVRPEALSPSLAPSEEINMTSPTPPVFEPAPKQEDPRTEVMTQTESNTSFNSEIFPVKENESQHETTAEMISRSMDIATLEAEIGRSIQAYAKLPRNKTITSRTKEYAYANYMDAWRTKVERIGNLNFPAEARRQSLSGDLMLDVMLNPDGTIREIKVLRSSGHKVLDDSAMRIVHMAAPYAPFTQDMKKETDVLHIIRTWQFRSSGISTRSN